MTQHPQLFTTTATPRCPACNTNRKNLCAHDADIREGIKKAASRRPKGCLNRIDPATAEIPF